MKAVILAGGKGTRLRPITYLNPKPMLPLVNKPFMENFIMWLKHYKIEDIILSTCYLPEVFEKYFGDGRKLGVNLRYETESCPLGTCGAVKNLEDYLGNEPFLVFNGDILTSLNLKQMMAFHKKNRADITISLTPVEDPTAYGLVPIDKEGRVTRFLEKPSLDEINTNLINAGTYMIEPHIMGLAPKGENYSFERGLFPKALSNEYRIYGFVSNAYWLDVGTPEKYLNAHFDILDRKIKFDFGYKKRMQNIYLGKDVKSSKNSLNVGPVVVGDGTVIEDGATILPQTVIGENCHIGEGSAISSSILFSGVKVGKNCNIKESIISKDVKISNNVKVEEYSVIGDNSVIEEDNILKCGIKVNINTKIKKGSLKF